jgi:hypothetical protein
VRPESRVIGKATPWNSTPIEAEALKSTPIWDDLGCTPSNLRQSGMVGEGEGPALLFKAERASGSVAAAVPGDLQSRVGGKTLPTERSTVILRTCSFSLQTWKAPG